MARMRPRMIITRRPAGPGAIMMVIALAQTSTGV